MLLLEYFNIYKMLLLFLRYFINIKKTFIIVFIAWREQLL